MITYNCDSCHTEIKNPDSPVRVDLKLPRYGLRGLDYELSIEIPRRRSDVRSHGGATGSEVFCESCLLVNLLNALKTHREIRRHRQQTSCDGSNCPIPKPTPPHTLFDHPDFA